MDRRVVFMSNLSDPTYEKTQRADESRETFIQRCVDEVRDGTVYVGAVITTKDDDEFVAQFWSAMRGEA